MFYRWLFSAPIEEPEAVENALGENAPVAMAAEALKARGEATAQAEAKPQATQWSPAMGAMDDGQYIARKGCRCPSCGAYSIESNGSGSGEGGEAWQNVKCRECHAQWSDSYTLTGYCEMEGGIDLESIASVVEDVKTRAEEYGFSIDSEAQARECVDESCDFLEPQLTDVDRKIAVIMLTS